jgi:hypothetical protein
VVIRSLLALHGVNLDTVKIGRNPRSKTQRRALSYPPAR